MAANDVVHNHSVTMKSKNIFTEFVLRLVWKDWRTINTLRKCGASLGRKQAYLALLFQLSYCLFLKESKQRF